MPFLAFSLDMLTSCVSPLSLRRLRSKLRLQMERERERKERSNRSLRSPLKEGEIALSKEPSA